MHALLTNVPHSQMHHKTYEEEISIRQLRVGSSPEIM